MHCSLFAISNRFRRQSVWQEESCCLFPIPPMIDGGLSLHNDTSAPLVPKLWIHHAASLATNERITELHLSHNTNSQYLPIDITENWFVWCGFYSSWFQRELLNSELEIRHRSETNWSQYCSSILVLFGCSFLLFVVSLSCDPPPKRCQEVLIDGASMVSIGGHPDRRNGAIEFDEPLDFLHSVVFGIVVDIQLKFDIIMGYWWFSFPFRLDWRSLGDAATTLARVGIVDRDCRGLYEAERGVLMTDDNSSMELMWGGLWFRNLAGDRRPKIFKAGVAPLPRKA